MICEKPLALDAAGAQELVDAAADAGLCAAVPFVYRYYPTVREARERVRGGQTGALRLLHGSYLQDWLLRPDDDNWRVDARLGGASRAFADIGSHWCDLAEFVSGHRIVASLGATAHGGPRAGRAQRAGTRSRPTSGPARPAPVATEDAALVQFETDGGAIGSVVVSQISAGRKNRLWIELDGAEEALAFDQEQPGGALVRPARGGDDPAPRSRDALARRRALRLPSRRPPAGLRRLLRRVRGRRLRGRRAAAPTWRACRRSPTGCAPR